MDPDLKEQKSCGYSRRGAGLDDILVSTTVRRGWGRRFQRNLDGHRTCGALGLLFSFIDSASRIGRGAAKSYCVLYDWRQGFRRRGAAP